VGVRPSPSVPGSEPDSGTQGGWKPATTDCEASLSRAKGGGSQRAPTVAARACAQDADAPEWAYGPRATSFRAVAPQKNSIALYQGEVHKAGSGRALASSKAPPQRGHCEKSRPQLAYINPRAALSRAGHAAPADQTRVRGYHIPYAFEYSARAVLTATIASAAPGLPLERDEASERLPLPRHTPTGVRRTIGSGGSGFPQRARIPFYATWERHCTCLEEKARL